MAENNNATVEKEPVLKQFLESKADTIKYLILAIVVILVAAVAIVSQQRRAAQSKESEASNAVFQSMIDAQSGTDAESIAVFKKAADDFSGLPAGGQARMIQFALAFKEGEYAAAEQAAKDFLKTYPQSPFAPRARMAAGQAQLMQGKTEEAIPAFRQIVSSGNPETLPEAKLALAQALEMSAEAVKDNPDEYRSRLEQALAEYTDIVTRSQNPNVSLAGYWPQTVVLPSDFAMTVIKDKLAGHTYESPASLRPSAAITEDEIRAVQAATMPANDAAPAEETEKEAE